MRNRNPLRDFAAILMALGPIVAWINFHALIHIGLFVAAGLSILGGMFLFMLAVTGSDSE